MRRGDVVYPLMHDREWLAAQLAAHRTYDEIATAAGCSRAVVYHALVRFDLRRYDRPELVRPLVSDRAFVEATIEFGPPLHRLCEVFDTSNVTVRLWLTKHGLYDRWREARARRVEADKEQTRARREANKPGPRYPRLRDVDRLKADVEQRGVAAVSREIGCHISSVMRALERAGVDYVSPRAGGGRPPNPMTERAVMLYEVGYTATQIAPIVGTSFSTVCKWVKDAGISRGAGRPRKPQRRES